MLVTASIDGDLSEYESAVRESGADPLRADAGDPDLRVLDRVQGLLLSGGDDVDPAAYGGPPLQDALSECCCGRPERSGRSHSGDPDGVIVDHINSRVRVIRPLRGRVGEKCGGLAGPAACPASARQVVPALIGESPAGLSHSRSSSRAAVSASDPG